MSSARGFSLLEVVVALAVLALVLGALYPIFSSSARQALLARDYGEAVSLAQSKLADVEVLAPGVQSGQGTGRFRWQRTIEPLASEESAPVLYRIAVQVQWGERAITLTTLRLGART
jgi:general secretion pathway protein I